MTSTAKRISVLTTIGVLALAVPVAQAGGGMGAGSGVTTCRAVSSAPDQPQTIVITDQLGASTVVVATAALVCDLPASGQTVKGPSTGVGPDPEAETTVVTCYTVRQADRARLPATIQDAFGTQSVNLGGIQLLCVPSTVTPTPAS